MDQQLSFALIARMNGPSIAHPSDVKKCKTFREACRMAWAHRRVRNMTLRQLAIEAGLRPQLITDYLHSDDNPQRRSLPADRVADFEAIVGNSLVSQWLAARAALTVVEEMQALRAA